MKEQQQQQQQQQQDLYPLTTALSQFKKGCRHISAVLIVPALQQQE
jgi:hypothetical protein